VRQFDVYKNDTGSVEAVKRGFSWPGLIWPIIWPYMVNLKPLFWGAAVFYAVLFQVPKFVPSATMGCVVVGALAAILVGVFGNQLRRSGLEGSGYRLVETVPSSSLKATLESLQPRARTPVERALMTYEDTERAVRDRFGPDSRMRIVRGEGMRIEVKNAAGEFECVGKGDSWRAAWDEALTASEKRSLSTAPSQT
jgi:hypothetical protein